MSGMRIRTRTSEESLPVGTVQRLEHREGGGGRVEREEDPHGPEHAKEAPAVLTDGFGSLESALEFCYFRLELEPQQLLGAREAGLEVGLEGQELLRVLGNDVAETLVDFLGKLLNFGDVTLDGRDVRQGDVEAFSALLKLEEVVDGAPHHAFRCGRSIASASGAALSDCSSVLFFGRGGGEGLADFLQPLLASVDEPLHTLLADVAEL
mmetsp:Transcript_5724/g.10537  ORF Transcript_5724/g.10537 Transcript_5724/m.10537 type:complete len:209 (+) Transcript_5724:1814-2440(+)